MNDREKKGYLFGVLTAICWAISPIFINFGLQGLPSSIWGTAIGLIAATVIYLLWLLGLKKVNFKLGKERNGVNWQVLGGITSGLGILLRNIALNIAPVAVVMSLSSITPLFTLIISPLLLRQNYKERISKRLIGGVLITVVGCVLIVLGR